MRREGEKRFFGAAAAAASCQGFHLTRIANDFLDMGAEAVKYTTFAFDNEHQ